MASLYLLGNPDHCTNQNFTVCYWKSYVTEVLKAWKQDSEVQPDKVILLKNVDGEFIGLSIVDDYKYRPHELSGKSLYSRQQNLSNVCTIGRDTFIPWQINILKS